MKEKIDFYGYPIDLTYGKGQKNIYLRIHPSQGKISLSLDQKLGKKGALAFLEDKKDWLFQRISPHQVLEDPDYIEGERHFLWGRAYPLKLVQGDKNRVDLRGDDLVMTLKEDLDREGRETLLLEFYRSLNMVWPTKPVAPKIPSFIWPPLFIHVFSCQPII